MRDKLERAKEASYKLMMLSTKEKNDVLFDCADLLIENIRYILDENEKDLENARANNMTEGLYDRLKLTDERIRGMADGLHALVRLPDPTGAVAPMYRRPNGLMIGKKRIPFGVVGIIYESRPNVTADAFGICFKSGNVCVLRGGSEALNSCKAITDVIKKALVKRGIDENVITYLENTDHESIRELITANKLVDLVIPRGGKGLIDFVLKNATIPSIQTGTGNCHVYVDEFADLEMAVDIIVNAKTSRLGVCNACESLVVHKTVAEKFAPMINEALKPYNVEIRADETARGYCGEFAEATSDDWGTEYLDRKISLKIVDSIEEAILHINMYNTGHSETIVTDKLANADYFLTLVDAACVYVNASTRFTDGSEFGFGAEIGISTQKLHARGPMGLKELTCEKHVIIGSGQIRE